jgi:hypothetical protein
MKNRIAATLLMLCLAGAASAQTTDVQSEQNKQTSKSTAKAAKKRAAKADQAMAEDTQTSSAIAKTACATTDAAGQPQMNDQAKKTEGDPTASQNVVEYGGGGF